MMYKSFVITAALILMIVQCCQANKSVSLLRYVENETRMVVVCDSLNDKNNLSIEIALWDTEQKSIVWQTPLNVPELPKSFHSEYIASSLDLCISKDGNTIIIAISSYGLLCIDYRTGRLIKLKFVDFHVIAGDSKSLLGAVAFSNDKEYVAVCGCYSRSVYVLNLETILQDSSSIIDAGFSNQPSLIKISFELMALVRFTCLRFSSEDSILYTGTENGFFYGWQVNGESSYDAIFTRRLGSSNNLFNDLWSIDSNDSCIITTSYSFPKYGQVQWWKREGVVLIKSYADFPQTTAKRIKLNAKGNFLVITSDICYILCSTDNTGITELYRIYLGGMAYLFENLGSVAFSTKEDVVALGIGANIYLFDCITGEITQSFYPVKVLPTVRNLLLEKN
ncbi:MAG: hypothetical protein QM802_09260 [Agriterribacter sp.]